jgi:hypothetical protein
VKRDLPRGYLDIHRRILVEKARFDPLLEPPPLALHVGPGAVIDPGARWAGFLEVGEYLRRITKATLAYEGSPDLDVLVRQAGPTSAWGRREIRELEIRWPSGAVQAIKAVPATRFSSSTKIADSFVPLGPPGGESWPRGVTH